MSLDLLLNKYIIVKEGNEKEYYKVKDNLDEYKKFIDEVLGYRLIINEKFIKLEKLPVRPKSWMGITTFQDKREYIFLILVLMFLEDKNREDQFILSNITEYIEHNYSDSDWTKHSVRKSLIRTLDFCFKYNIIKMNDGRTDDFIASEEGEMLLENTGISRYIVRSFDREITQDDTYESLLEENVEGLSNDRGKLRKNRAFRQLVLDLAVYSKDNENDFEYIKNYRSYVKEIFEQVLQCDVQVYKNMAIAVYKQATPDMDVYPLRMQGESQASLFINKKIRRLINKGSLTVDSRDVCTLKKQEFSNILLDARKQYGHGFTKALRDLPDDRYVQNMIAYMESYYLIEVIEDNILIMPLVGKIEGAYPQDYKETGEE